MLRIAEDLDIRVAPLHVIAILKMISYMDRPDSREKDLADLAHIMHGYVGDDSDRRYSQETSDDAPEFDDVAPYILGRDVARVFNAEERSYILRFIATIHDDSRGTMMLARMAARGPVSWRDPDLVFQRLLAFERGMMV